MQYKKQVVIFGVSQTAELANHYLTADSEYEVAAFTVNSEYKTVSQFEGLPVVEFENVHNEFPPDDFKMFAPMTAIKMNALRKNIYVAGIKMGYEFISYVSSRCINFASSIGKNCFILENNVLQPKVEIGDNCILWSGNHVGHHSKIREHNFFTSHVVMGGNCEVGSQCFFGINSTIRDGCKIADGTLIGMGAALSKTSTKPWGVYTGSPAKCNNKRKSVDYI